MAEVFFVLNTGRAGSKTVAETLSQAPDCECLHEPEPRLIEEAARFRYGQLGADKLARLLRTTRHPASKSVCYGETNNKLALVVPVLEQAFAGNKYVWLVRDGRDFVASVLQRGWFSDEEQGPQANPWQQWRLRGDLLGEVEPAVWQSWSQFERCCWIWDFTNRLIKQDLGCLDAERWRLLRIEELAKSVRSISSFLEIKPTDFVVRRANRRTTGDDHEGSTNRVERVATWHDWSPEQRGTFAQRCGELMDELYPGWRVGDEWVDSVSEVEGAATIMAAAGGASGPGQLGSIRADLAELKLLRGDLRALTRTHAAAQSQASKHAELIADGLAEARERANDAEQEQRRLARSLEQTRKELATAVGRCQRLEADRDRQRQKAHTARQERDQARRQLAALRCSTGYQLGHAVVFFLKLPLRLARRGLYATRRTAAAVAARLRPISKVLPIGDAPVEEQTAPAGGQEAVARTVLSEQHPVYAYVAFGFGPEQLCALARAARQHQLASANHVPLIVTDSAAFPLARETGVAIEHVPDRETWQRHRGEVPWSRFRSARLAHLLRLHAPQATYFLDTSSKVGLEQLLDLQPERSSS